MADALLSVAKRHQDGDARRVHQRPEEVGLLAVGFVLHAPEYMLEMAYAALQYHNME
jgi:hypothetical protein